MTKLASDVNSKGIQCLRPNSTETVSVSGTAASSSAISGNVVRIVSDVDIFVNLNTTATTSDCLIPAASAEYFRVNNGETISVIAIGSGTAYITTMG